MPLGSQFNMYSAPTIANKNDLAFLFSVAKNMTPFFFNNLAEFSELDDSIIIKPNNNRRVSEMNMNNSYKIVNDKIIKLKKLEFDNCTFTEILKHYSIVQELIVKQLYDNNNDVK